MRLLALLTTLVVPALLVAAPVPKEKEKAKDEDAILGTWKIEKFDAGGGPSGPGPAELEKIRFIFEKDGKMKFVGGPGGDDSVATYKIDPTAKVKTLDLTITRPGDKPDTALGIYELDGDTFKWCMAEGANKARPEEMKADGKRVVVVTFTRVKDEKKDK
jgi:uncharacterized protein (TIGR03067 family)